MTSRTNFRFVRDRFDESPDEDIDRIRRAELRDIEADRRHDEEAIYGSREEARR